MVHWFSWSLSGVDVSNRSCSKCSCDSNSGESRGNSVSSGMMDAGCCASSGCGGGDGWASSASCSDCMDTMDCCLLGNVELLPLEGTDDNSKLIYINKQTALEI